MLRSKKFWFRMAVAAILALVIVYTFYGSWREILGQIAQTSVWIVVLILLSSVVYHFFEALITWYLARHYRPDFRYRDAVYCAFNCSFYRLSTMGTGTGVAAVLYLEKKGVGYSEATGLYLIQYMLHKISIALYSGIFFLLNFAVMAANYKNYAPYLILAYGLTVAISFGLILLAVYPKSHQIILWMVKKVNRNGRLDTQIVELELYAKLLEKSAAQLLKDAKSICVIVLMNLVKLCFWYGIPFFILLQSAQISLLSSFSVTSLSVMTAAVIPTPVGIGSTELVMTALYGVLTDVETAAAVTLLYRIATFYFPFVLGGVMIPVRRLAARLLRRVRKTGRLR